MKQKTNKPLLIGLVAAETVCAVLAWRDLGRRCDDQIRGTKQTWRMVILINPGNSLAYWAFGRRRRPQTPSVDRPARTATQQNRTYGLTGAVGPGSHAPRP